MTRHRLLNIATIVSLVGAVASAAVVVRSRFASDYVLYRSSTPRPARAHGWWLSSGGGMLQCGWQYDDYRTPPGWHYDKSHATAWTDGALTWRFSDLRYYSGQNVVTGGFTVDYKMLVVPLGLVLLTFAVLPVARVVALLVARIRRALPGPMVTLPAAAQQFRRG